MLRIPDAQQEGTLGGPVPAGAAAVALASQLSGRPPCTARRRRTHRAWCRRAGGGTHGTHEEVT